MELMQIYVSIRNHVRLIAIGTLITSITALTFSLVIPPSYQASSELVLFKSKAEITLNPQFQTLTEDQLIRLSGQDPRRQTLAALAISDHVLSETVARLPERMRQKWTASRLKEQAKIETTGNLIKLSVVAGNPEEAADITNMWAITFAEVANQAFRTPSEALDSIYTQVEEALEEYKQAEERLLDFLRNNQIDEIQLQIDIKERAIEDLKNTFSTTTQTELVNLLISKQQLPQIARDIETLKGLVAQIPDNEVLDQSTQVALVLLQARVFNVVQILPTQLQSLPVTELQISIPSSTESALMAGQARKLLDQLGVSVISLGNQLEKTFDQKSLTSLQNPGPSETLATQIQTMQKEIDILKALLESEEAKKKELTSERDLAWNNYNILSQKASEVSIANKTAETEVVIATRAVPPEEPYSPKIILNTAIGFISGLLGTLAVALLRNNLRDIQVKVGG